MADSILTPPVETQALKPTEALLDREHLPIELRSDVTVDELEKLAAHHPAELYNGKVVFKMPNFAHGVIVGNLVYEIRAYLKAKPIGLVSDNANYRFWPERAKESRAPDLSFILKERLPENLHRYLPIVPDLAVEILSPDDSFNQMMEKVDEYLSQGVKLVWVVITSTHEVLVCNKQSKHIVRDKLTAPELLPGFELPIKEIFAGIEKNAAQ